MKRVLTPELIDVLPANDPRAVRSRRDILRLNRINQSDALMARLLRRVAGNPAPQMITDLGSGDGLFMLHVARRLARHWRNVSIRIVDTQPAVAPETFAAFKQLDWQAEVVKADVSIASDWSRNGERHFYMANLFLHHFNEDQLRGMFQRIAEHASSFVAIDPVRGRAQHFVSRCLWLFGCGAVTRHDGPASFRAGFRDQELSALWPANGTWKLDERQFGPFSHTFIATRAR
ncbi:MAG TPA: hypothetical protein VFZ59_27395 [Verrucomicrobiae bacterium]|nr:hypothetical protein [Verrucomicrobiae bacterium]